MVFWDEDTTPLLGAVTLEIFSLGIDPVNNQLIPMSKAGCEIYVTTGMGLNQ